MLDTRSVTDSWQGGKTPTFLKQVTTKDKAMRPEDFIMWLIMAFAVCLAVAGIIVVFKLVIDFIKDIQ